MAAAFDSIRQLKALHAPGFAGRASTYHHSDLLPRIKSVSVPSFHGKVVRVPRVAERHAICRSGGHDLAIEPPLITEPRRAVRYVRRPRIPFIRVHCVRSCEADSHWDVDVLSCRENCPVREDLIDPQRVVP